MRFWKWSGLALVLCVGVFVGIVLAGNPVVAEAAAEGNNLQACLNGGTTIETTEDGEEVYTGEGPDDIWTWDADRGCYVGRWKGSGGQYVRRLLFIWNGGYGWWMVDQYTDSPDDPYHPDSDTSESERVCEGVWTPVSK